MIALNSSQKLELVLSGAKATNDCPFAVTAIDSNAGINPTGLYNNVGTSNGTSAVDAVVAPSAGNIRLVKSLMFFNADTAQVTVTIQINQGSTYALCKLTLNIGDSLQYTPEEGFVVTDGVGTRRAGGYSGYSGFSGIRGYSGWSGMMGYSGWSGSSGTSGWSAWSGTSGYSAASPGDSGYSGFSGRAMGNYMPGGWE